MPIQFFARQQEPARPQPIQYPETIEPSRSTDSQIDACKENKLVSTLKYSSSRQNVESQTCDLEQPRSRSPSSASSSSSSLSNPFRKTSPISPEGSWRAKDFSARSPIFQEERAPVSEELEAMWTIKRCDAFCYNYVSDDDDEEEHEDAHIKYDWTDDGLCFH
jgi:hypothetical protein